MNKNIFEWIPTVGVGPVQFGDSITAHAKNLPLRECMSPFDEEEFMCYGYGDDEEDEDEDFSGLMDDEVREELVQAKKAEKRALRELEAMKRLLDEAGDGEEGDLLRVMRQEMDQAKQELAGI